MKRVTKLLFITTLALYPFSVKGTSRMLSFGFNRIKSSFEKSTKSNQLQDDVINNASLTGNGDVFGLEVALEETGRELRRKSQTIVGYETATRIQHEEFTGYQETKGQEIIQLKQAIDNTEEEQRQRIRNTSLHLKETIRTQDNQLNERKRIYENQCLKYEDLLLKMSNQHEENKNLKQMINKQKSSLSFYKKVTSIGVGTLLFLAAVVGLLYYFSKKRNNIKHTKKHLTTQNSLRSRLGTAFI